MSNGNIRIGFIGCGWIVEHAHIPAFRMIEDVSVSSVFDIDLARASKLGKLYDIPGVYNDLGDFFDSGIDAVIIATPNHTHVHYSLQALERGMDALCEKPVAVHGCEVEHLMAAAKANHCLFIPGFVNRFRSDIQQIRELVQSHKIGDIVDIKAGWLRRTGIPRPGTWFTSKAHSGGGALIDLGSHIIDLGLMLLGDREPVTTSLTTSTTDNQGKELGARWFHEDYEREFAINVEDTAIAHVEFDGNVSMEVKLSWTAELDGDCTYFSIQGSSGRIDLRTLFGFSRERLWKDDRLVIAESHGNLRDVPLNPEMNQTKKAFEAMAKFFTSAVKERNAAGLSGADARKTVALIEQLYQNERRTGRKINAMDVEGL